MKIKKNTNQQGIALVTSLVLSTLVITVVGVMVYKTVSTTKDTILIHRQDTAKFLADEGLEHVVDWMNNRNSPQNYLANSSLAPTIESAQDLLRNMTTTEFLTPINTWQSNYTYSLSGSLSNLTNGAIYKVPTNSLISFGLLRGGNIKSTFINSNGISKVINELGDNSVIYRYDGISNNNSKFKGEFELGVEGITPTRISSYFDVIKAVVVSYTPSRDNPLIKRKFVAVLQRPKDVRVSLDQAILSDGNINLGNGDSTGGTLSTLVAQEGDVHTNGNLSIGPNGKVDGDASATGTITNGGTYDAVAGKYTNVTGTSTPNAPEKPIPTFDYDNPFPITPCIDLDLTSNIKFVGPCKYTGDLNLAGSDKIVITGKIYIQGNYKESGNSTLEALSTPLQPFAMLIASGNIQTSGNGATNGSKMAFISTGGDMKVVGNGNVQGLFVNDNPNGEIDVTGNANIFGGIISQGTVKFSGNNSTVKRDITLSNLPVKHSPDEYSMRLISWKEIK